MNSESSKASHSHRLVFNNIKDLGRGEKSVALSNFDIYYTLKISYRNNKFKISAPTWNVRFELPDVSYFISDI